MKLFNCIAIVALSVACPAQGKTGPYARVARAAQLLGAGRAHECRGLLRSALRQIPHHAQGWYLLGLADTRLARHKRAHRSFSRCVRLAPRHVAARLALAEALLVRDRTAASRHALVALEHAKRTKCLARATRVLAQAGDAKAASRGLAKLAKLNLAPSERLHLEAEVQLASKKPQQAARAYEKLHKLRPNDPLPIESLANIAAQRRDFQVEKAWLSRLLRLRPSDVALRQRYVRVLQAAGEHRDELERQRVLIRQLGETAGGSPRRPTRH